MISKSDDDNNTRALLKLGVEVSVFLIVIPKNSGTI